jgi:predicted nucleic acid-binding Zn ribbon protein
MALMQCPECGKEISDKAKVCPICGYGLKKKRNKKSIRTTLIIVVIVIIAVSGVVAMLLQNRHRQIITQINDEIQKLSDVPSQEEYDRIVGEYNDLSDEEKKEIIDISNLEKYEDFDLDNLRSIVEEVNNIDESTKFSKVLEIKEKYDALNSEEKNCVDYNNIQLAMELSDVENAALTGCKNIQSCMKSKDNFKVNQVTVKDDIEKMSFYWVLIKYTGTNSFGGSVDSTSCFGIDPTFTDPFFGLAQITGGTSKYLDSTTSYLEYTDCDKTEITVDVDKIMYYLNE